MVSLLDIPRPVKTYHSERYDRIDPTKAKFDGKGKTILVTGGATGIGYSISTSFAEAGASRIIIVSRSPGPQAAAKEALENKFPGLQVLTFQASTTDLKRVEEIFQSVGAIDVLVLNAAVSHVHTATLDIPSKELVDTFDVNIMGNINVVRSYLASPKPASGSKTVIHVSSGAAHLPLPNQTGYGPSKGAFTHVLQILSTEYTPEKDGVRMFNFHPGAFYTDMAKSAGYTETGSFVWEDIRVAGDFAVWLAGSESNFLNGKFMWAQWDVDELIQLKEKVEKDPSFLTLGLVL